VAVVAILESLADVLGNRVFRGARGIIFERLAVDLAILGGLAMVIGIRATRGGPGIISESLLVVF
jgi:hypothetical protein